MGALYKSLLSVLDDTGLSGAATMAGLPRLFPFHEVGVFCCLAASFRPAEERYVRLGSSSKMCKMSWLASSLICGFLVLAFLLIDSRTASALPIPAGRHMPSLLSRGSTACPVRPVTKHGPS